MVREIGGHARFRSLCTSIRAPEPTSAARKQHCWNLWKGSEESRESGRRSRRITGSTASRPLSAMLKRLPSFQRSLPAARIGISALGNPKTPGTKLYTLLGEVNRPGLFEAPLGLTLRQIIDTFGEGMRDGSTFRFALTGGAAGTLVPPSLLDVPMDYDSASQGVALGQRRHADLRSIGIAAQNASRAGPFF